MTEATPRVWGARPRPLPRPACTARALWIPAGAGMTGAAPRVWAIAPRPLPRPACTARALWIPAGAGMTGAAPRVWAIAPRSLPRPVCTARALWIPAGAGMTGAAPHVPRRAPTRDAPTPGRVPITTRRSWGRPRRGPWSRGRGAGRGPRERRHTPDARSLLRRAREGRSRSGGRGAP